VETAVAIRTPALERMPVETFLERHAVQPASDEDYLLSMLREHGTDIYDPVEVSRYMKQRELREFARKRMAVRHEASLRLVVSKTFLVATPLFLAVVCAVFGVGSWLVAAVPVAVILMGCCWAASVGAQEWIDSVRAVWEDTEIDLNSSVEMPVRVRELLVHLRSTSPKLGFHLSELKVYVDSKPALFDPIGFVSYGEAQFPIAVWDEPGFYAPLIG